MGSRVHREESKVTDLQVVFRIAVSGLGVDVFHQICSSASAIASPEFVPVSFFIAIKQIDASNRAN